MKWNSPVGMLRHFFKLKGDKLAARPEMEEVVPFLIMPSSNSKVIPERGMVSYVCLIAVGLEPRASRGLGSSAGCSCYATSESNLLYKCRMRKGVWKHLHEFAGLLTF